MHFKNEIQNMLRSVGINTFEANKSIFGITAIGLLIGKDKLETIIYDIHAMEEREHFNKEVMSFVPDNNSEKIEIAHSALELISESIDGKMLTHIAEIILQFDLLENLLHMNIFDYDMGFRDCPISSISWINELVVAIFRQHKGRLLLNIDCGTGDFIQQMVEGGKIERAAGYTFDNLNYTIAKITCFFSDKQYIVCKQSLISPATEEKYDVAYNSYPLAYKYDIGEIEGVIDSWDFEFDFRRRYSADMLWIINALQSIKPDGMVAALVPNGVLFNNIDVDIRKYLIENNYIDTIISLPNGILPFTNVGTSLIILKKNKQKQAVHLINASKIYSEQRRYKYFSKEDIACIIDYYLEEKHTENSLYITCEEIGQNDFYLGINRYSDSSLINPCSLSEVTRNIFRGYQINAKELDAISIENEDSDYRIINISDIQADGFINNDLKVVKIDNVIKYNKYCVKDGDIIITAKNTTIKSAIYRNHGKYKAILTGNLIAIRSNETKISPYYLKAFLDSEQGRAALKSIQTGTTIITLNPNSLKDMKVSLLPMDQQILIADKYIKNLNLIEELLEKYNAASDRMSKIFDVTIQELLDKRL